MTQEHSAMISSFAPTGTLRVGINLGNPLLANTDQETRQIKGITVDIANEIAQSLSLPIILASYSTAGATVEAIKNGDVDLVFVAIDPVRAADISYTPAYIQIEGAYLVKENSPLTRNEDVDAPGNTILVGKGSAYDLYLTREIKQATLMRSVSSQAVVDDFMNEAGNVAAGVRQQLEADAQRYSGLKMLPGQFMVINQAIGIPKSRVGYENTNRYLSALIAKLKQSGFVAQAMHRYGIQGAKVAD
jgi:polar amino acid transport system substrate-binding protein